MFYNHSWVHGGKSFDVSQFGTGLELIGSWLDLRLNYYHPDSTSHVTGSRSLGKVAAPLGMPFGTGHSIVQDYQWLGINQESLAAAGEGWD